MINTPSNHTLPRSVTISLKGIDQATQDWMRQCEPSLQFSDGQAGSVSAACYGDNYQDALATDYEFNSKHKIRTLLCLLRDSPESFVHLLQLHVRHVIFPGMPFDAEAFLLAIAPSDQNRAADASPFFSVRHHELRSVVQLPVTCADDFHSAVEATSAYFQDQKHTGKQADAASLVVKEALTNSIYHGFRQADSHERKYDPDDFAGLDDTDEVTLSLAATPDWIIVRIADNIGALGPLRLANSLDRQISQRGLLDHRGRGFYLMRNLSDRMVITIARGQSTAVEFYFLTSPVETPASKKHFELYEL